MCGVTPHMGCSTISPPRRSSPGAARQAEKALPLIVVRAVRSPISAGPVGLEQGPRPPAGPSGVGQVGLGPAVVAEAVAAGLVDVDRGLGVSRLDLRLHLVGGDVAVLAAQM